MSVQAFSSASIPRVTLMDAGQDGAAALTAPTLRPRRLDGVDDAAVQRFSDIMNGAAPAGSAMPAAGVAAVEQASEAGVSSLFHSAAARHVAMGVQPARNSGAVTQRFIDTMNSAAAIERGAAEAEFGMAVGAAAGEAGPGGVKAGLSSLFGKISAMHADLEKRFMDPASYTSAARMIGLQRMTGMYSIYFETVSKSVFKVVRDADAFMKSNA